MIEWLDNSNKQLIEHYTLEEAGKISPEGTVLYGGKDDKMVSFSYTGIDNNSTKEDRPSRRKPGDRS